jgi:hypothetical protein
MKLSHFNRFLIAPLFIAGFILISNPAYSSLTVIYQSSVNEPDLLSGLPVGPDGNGSPKNNPAFSTPIITTLQSSLGFTSYSRVDDAADQLWSPTGNTVSVSLLGQFAGDTEGFGFFNGTTGMTFNQVLTAMGGATQYFTGITATFTPASVFRMGLDNVSTNTLLSSQTSDNADGQDHMVTFLITSGSLAGDYIIAFEDELVSQNGDFDYNDNILLISGATILQAPEPATYATLGGTLLLGTLLLRRKERLA